MSTNDATDMNPHDPTASPAGTPRRPLIGVCPLIDYKLQSYWMLPGYFEGIQQAGGIPVMLPPTSDHDELVQLLGTIDGLLVTGGQDASPALYGDASPEAAARCGELVPERDAMEAALVPMAVEADLPVLGICRGIQVINATLGGTLWQDLPTQHPSAVEHHGKPPYDVPVHAVEVLPETPLAATLEGCPEGMRLADDGAAQAGSEPDATPTQENASESRGNAPEHPVPAGDAANPGARMQNLHAACCLAGTSQVDTTTETEDPQVDASSDSSLLRDSRHNSKWGVRFDGTGHPVARDDAPAAPEPTRLANLAALPVNSYHHQAIRELAPGLSPMAYAPDGIVEAVWRPASRFVWGVQWHPEFAWRVDAPSRAIFRAFVEAAGA